MYEEELAGLYLQNLAVYAPVQPLPHFFGITKSNLLAKIKLYGNIATVNDEEMDYFSTKDYFVISNVRKCSANTTSIYIPKKSGKGYYVKGKRRLTVLITAA